MMANHLDSYMFTELRRLHDLYNPENDLIPNTIRVTHTDKVLLDCILELQERIQKLEEKCDG